MGSISGTLGMPSREHPHVGNAGQNIGKRIYQAGGGSSNEKPAGEVHMVMMPCSAENQTSAHSVWQPVEGLRKTKSPRATNDLFWKHMSSKLTKIMHSFNDTISRHHAWGTIYEYGAL